MKTPRVIGSEGRAAHLWFVAIHPFEDSNGRIARAIADMALARSEQSSQQFYSMSAQIRQERADYYDILERTEATLGTVLNERQRLIVNRLLDGFEAKPTMMKYGKSAQCSHHTALRDIAALVERGILVRNPEGGSSTSYSLAKVT
jgi:Fic family protein